MTSLEQTFGRIYRRNLWNGSESLSGPGSGFAPTRVAAEFILSLVEVLEVRTVLDVGCGDSLWMPPLPGYLGIDVAREAVARAKRLHPNRRYQVHDAVRSIPGSGWDLVICRDVLQHLPMDMGLRLLANLRRAGVRRMVASTYTGASERHVRDRPNVDIRPGECFCNVLTEPPFGLPDPVAKVPDGWDYTTGAEVRDGAKWLALFDLSSPPEGGSGAGSEAPAGQPPDDLSGLPQAIPGISGARSRTPRTRSGV